MTETEQLITGASALGIDLSQEGASKAIAYLNAIYRQNELINLTRVPREEAVERHLLDSLACVPALRHLASGRIVDVGTGGGFPGAPLAVALPHLQFTLLDSTGKKLRAVDAALAEAGIENAVTLQARAEDHAKMLKPSLRYDAAVSRAVAPMDRLAGWLLPLVKAGGKCIALKSEDAEAEIETALPAIHKAGGKLETVLRMKLPSGVIRLVVVLVKQSPR